MITQALDAVLITLLDGDLVQHPEHLGVAYLAAELRKAGHTVEIFPTSPANEADVIACILELKPRLIGFSLTTASFARATRIGQRIRENLGHATHITAGGPLVTAMGASLLRNPAWDFLDSAVRGDGEVPVLRLMEALVSGADLGCVPSLCHRTFAGVVCNPVAVAMNDLNYFSVPARDQVSHGPHTTARIATSRGCTSRCSFCNAPNASNRLVGKVWRGRSPESVVEEMETICHDMQVRDFEFVDSTFEDPGGTDWAKQRIACIAQGLIDKQLNITFGCCVQAQNWSIRDLWLIDLLKRAGLQRVLIGVESGSAETLKRWQKKATPADNHRAIGLFRSRSIYVNMGFIMFHPHSTQREVVENALFLRSTGCPSLRPFCTRMEVYPGTGILGELRNEGLLDSEYDSTLNPFAYQFVDREIERLAYAMALLAGEEYASSGTVDILPPHLQFGLLDLALHAEVTWKMRSDAKAGLPTGRYSEFFASYREVCDDLAAFNYTLFQTISGRVLSGMSAIEAIADLLHDVHSQYAERITDVSRIYSRCIDEQMPMAGLGCAQYSNLMAGVQ